MKITAEITRNVTVDASALDRQQIPEICFDEMNNTLKRLRDQIARGVGADGQRIKASGYSENYKQQIRDARGNYDERMTKRDGTRRSKPTKITSGNRNENLLAQKDENVVNLTVTGSMLATMQAERETSGARGYFNDQTQVLKASGLLDRGFEGWFEFGQVDLTRINDRFDKVLENVAETIVKQT